MLGDSGVSNVHARLIFKAGTWYVEDLGSQNGTLLNGVAIRSLVALKTGDALALGSALVGFAEMAESAPGRARISPEGVPSSARRATGEVLMPGMPVRRQKKGPEEVITASGEGETVDFADIDAEVTNPAGVRPAGFPDEGTSPVSTPAPRAALENFTEHARRPVQESTAIDVPLARPPEDDDQGGPETVKPGSRLTEGSTQIGPAPERTPLLVPRPSAPRPVAGPGLIPRPSAPKAPSSEVLVPRPSAPRPAGSEGQRSGAHRMGEPVPAPVPETKPSSAVLVPRPIAPTRPPEVPTGPRAGAAAQIAEQPTGPRAQGTPAVEDQQTAARVPVVEETRIHAMGTPSTSRPVVEETRIHALGPPSSTRPVVPTVPDPGAGGESRAAVRSRERRAASQSLVAAAVLKFRALSKRGQVLLAGGSLAALTVGSVVVALSLQGPSRPKMPPEPKTLVVNQTVEASFGTGETVDYPHSDEKQFRFEFSSPTEAAVVVHLQSRDLTREEISVSCNGIDVGFLPEDVGMPNREYELLVPPSALQKGDQNVLAFANVKTQNGSERWAVSNLRLDVVPIPPEVTPGAASDEARRLIKIANSLLETKEVGTANVYKAWKLHRTAWITLLAMPEAERNALFIDARRKSDELRRELDQRCGALLLEAKKQMELKNPDQAREILEQVPAYFPGTEHRCQNLAREKLSEYDL